MYCIINDTLTHQKSVYIEVQYKDFNDNDNDSIHNPANGHHNVEPFTSSTIISSIDDEEYNCYSLKVIDETKKYKLIYKL